MQQSSLVQVLVPPDQAPELNQHRSPIGYPRIAPSVSPSFAWITRIGLGPAFSRSSGSSVVPLCLSHVPGCPFVSRHRTYTVYILLGNKLFRYLSVLLCSTALEGRLHREYEAWNSCFETGKWRNGSNSKKWSLLPKQLQGHGRKWWWLLFEGRWAATQQSHLLEHHQIMYHQFQ